MENQLLFFVPCLVRLSAFGKYCWMFRLFCVLFLEFIWRERISCVCDFAGGFFVLYVDPHRSHCVHQQFSHVLNSTNIFNQHQNTIHSFVCVFMCAHSSSSISIATHRRQSFGDQKKITVWWQSNTIKTKRNESKKASKITHQRNDRLNERTNEHTHSSLSLNDKTKTGKEKFTKINIFIQLIR